MNPTDETVSLGPLFEALAKAQAKVKGAEKDATNPHFRSKYSTLASVWEACREALTSEGLAVAQTFDMDNGVAVMVTVLGHKSGAMLTGRYPLSPVKADPQGMAAAATYARRVGLAAMVGVAPEDDDGETAAGRGEAQQKGAASTPRAPEPPPPSKPPADPLTREDVETVFSLSKAAGFKTRDELLPLVAKLGGGATSLKAMDRAHLPELTKELKRLAGAAKDVEEIFGAPAHA